MKKVMGLCVLSLVLSVANVALAATDTKVEFGPVSHYIASPLFGKLLGEATEKANGWKIRVEYSIDDKSRTTSEVITVTVVGKADPKFVRSRFVISGTNGGWTADSAGVVTSEITEKEFVEFKE